MSSPLGTTVRLEVPHLTVFSGECNASKGRAGTMEARLSVRRLLRGPGALLTSAGFSSSAPFVAVLFGPSSSLSLPP